MNNAKRLAVSTTVCFLCSVLLCLTGCGESASLSPSTSSGIPQTSISPSASPILWNNIPEVLVPEASGVTTCGNQVVTIDASNVSKGYIMVKYTGNNPKVMLQIKNDSSETYTYRLWRYGEYEVFPFSEGDGIYSVNVYENISGTSYAQAFGTGINVVLENDFLPYLYPNQYVNFSSASLAVPLGQDLASGASDALEVVADIYNYVISNISYDYDKYENLESGYLPDIDDIIESGEGICFDYAALTTAMLRTQRIPTRLVIGYAGSVYHAWISVYIDGMGWVNDAIEFHGDEWVRLDPTFASNSNDPMEYTGSNIKYNEMFTY